jgi:hypothetical protein
MVVADMPCEKPEASVNTMPSPGIAAEQPAADSTMAAHRLDLLAPWFGSRLRLSGTQTGRE